MCSRVSSHGKYGTALEQATIRDKHRVPQQSLAYYAGAAGSHEPREDRTVVPGVRKFFVSGKRTNLNGSRNVQPWFVKPGLTN